MHTVLCAFEDRALAHGAVARMIRAGLPRHDIHLQPEAAFCVGAEADAVADADADADAGDRATQAGLLGHLAQFVRRLAPAAGLPGAEGTYRDAVRRGSAVVVVHVASADEALEAAALMCGFGAFDVEHCRSCWRRS